jgi:hypothetical protein
MDRCNVVNDGSCREWAVVGCGMAWPASARSVARWKASRRETLERERDRCVPAPGATAAPGPRLIADAVAHRRASAQSVVNGRLSVSNSGKKRGYGGGEKCGKLCARDSLCPTPTLSRPRQARPRPTAGDVVSRRSGLGGGLGKFNGTALSGEAQPPRSERRCTPHAARRRRPASRIQLCRTNSTSYPAPAQVQRVRCPPAAVATADSRRARPARGRRCWQPELFREPYDQRYHLPLASSCWPGGGGPAVAAGGLRAAVSSPASRARWPLFQTPPWAPRPTPRRGKRARAAHYDTGRPS